MRPSTLVRAYVRGSLPWRSVSFFPCHPSHTLPCCATQRHVSKGKRCPKIPWWSAAVRNVGPLGSLLSQGLGSGTAATATPSLGFTCPSLELYPHPQLSKFMIYQAERPTAQPCVCSLVSVGAFRIQSHIPPFPLSMPSSKQGSPLHVPPLFRSGFGRVS